MIEKFKPLAAAIGLSLALATGAASAQLLASSGTTLFEDDDIDFLFETGTPDGILQVGESLVAIFELNTANNVDIAPGELTGIAAITLVSITDLDGDGFPNDLVFAPATSLLNSLTGSTFDAGAAVAIYYDSAPITDLEISAGAVNGGTLSCTTLTQCVGQATDGTLWEVDGFNGDPDEYWIALNAQRNTNIVLAGSTANEFGAFNAGLSILYNGTGQNLAENSLACGVLCQIAGNAGGDGFVDVLGGGSIKGGGCTGPGTTGLCQYPDLIAAGAKATSDFDLTKAVQVPEPGTLALLATGILGLGMRLRRRDR